MQLHGVRVLVAEDEPVQAFDIRDLLTALGAEVIGPARTVEKALELATNDDFDCAVLDVKLKDGDIDPVARLIERQGKGIVFLTAYGANHLHEECPSAPIVSKPYLEPHLTKAVITVCRRSAGKAA